MVTTLTITSLTQAHIPGSASENYSSALLSSPSSIGVGVIQNNPYAPFNNGPSPPMTSTSFVAFDPGYYQGQGSPQYSSPFVVNPPGHYLDHFEPQNRPNLPSNNTSPIDFVTPTSQMEPNNNYSECNNNDNCPASGRGEGGPSSSNNLGIWSSFGANSNNQSPPPTHYFSVSNQLIGATRVWQPR